MSHEQGYPSESSIVSWLSSLGIELITEYTTDYMLEYRETSYAILNAVRQSMALSVYAANATTFNVRSGYYWWKGEIKQYTAGAAVNPTDNDTTYVWLTPSNTISSAVDGTGWPTTEHLKLAEIVVDSDGVITSITDRRAMAGNVGSYNNAGGASAEMLGIHWDSPSPADSDVMTIPLYGENDADEKIEYGQIKLTLDDVSDGDEDAGLSFAIMVGGALTSRGNFVGTASSNATGNSCAVQANASGGLLVVFKATLTAGSTVQVHNADAPYKYRVLDAWSVATSADGGTWKLTDGTNDITDAVSVTATDETIDRAGTIDDAYHEIASDGSLSVVGDGTLADVEVYIMAVRVS